jgi:hypothetical protein
VGEDAANAISTLTGMRLLAANIKGSTMTIYRASSHNKRVSAYRIGRAIPSKQSMIEADSHHDKNDEPAPNKRSSQSGSSLTLGS